MGRRPAVRGRPPAVGGRPGTRARIARAVTEAGAPTVLLLVLPVVVSAVSAGSVAAGIGWGLVAALFFAVVPYGWVVLGVRAGRITDRHVRRRDQRARVFAVTLASMLVGFAVLAVGGAPRALVAFLLGVLIEVVALLAVSLAWKISVHAWTAAAGTTALVALFGPWALLGWPVVAAVGWSRVRLRQHTVAQVVVGAAVGLGLTAALVPLLGRL